MQTVMEFTYAFRAMERELSISQGQAAGLFVGVSMSHDLASGRYKQRGIK